MAYTDKIRSRVEKEAVSLSLKDKAYGIIKDKIIRCEYLPGQILVEAEIIAAVGASRTPIREALNKLEQERLVRIMPKRGVFVSEITVSTVYDVYDVRELVEPYFIEEYGHLVPRKQIDLLYADLHALEGEESGPIEQIYSFDNNLHQILASYCSNTYLQVMMEQIYGQNDRMRILSGRDSGKRVRESQEEHSRILEALLRQDYPAAALAMKEHLRIARDAALAAISIKNRTSFGLE